MPVDLPPALSAFQSVANPILRDFLEPNSCIAATRITIECLQRFGVVCQPVPTKFAVELPRLKVAYISGMPESEEREARAKAASWRDLPSSKNGWNGHLVAVTDGWLIDSSFHQAEVAIRKTGHEYTGDREAVFLVPISESIKGGGVVLEGITDNDEPIRIQYADTGDESYRTTLAWELDHIEPLIKIITRRMRKLIV